GFNASVEFLNRKLCLTISRYGGRKLCVNSCFFRVAGCNDVIVAVSGGPRLRKLVPRRSEFGRTVLTSTGLVGLLNTCFGSRPILEWPVRTGCTGAKGCQRQRKQPRPRCLPQLIHRS